MARPGVCYRCRKTKVYDPLPPEALKPLKEVLLVDDPEFNPLMCDVCYDVVMGNAPLMETKNPLLRAS